MKFFSDLNKSRIKDGTKDGIPLQDFSTEDCLRGKVSVYFREIADRLIEKIEMYEVVVGCVAWLTHPDILQALSEKQGVSLLVQKDDLYRPDMFAKNRTAMQTQLFYSKLPGTLTRERDFLSTPYGRGVPDWKEEISPIEPVRCIGIYNKGADRKTSAPFMHNKFLVFCEKREIDNADYGWSGDPSMKRAFEAKIHGDLYPVAVWTGSFNFSKNASKSFENALFIEDEGIAEAYFNEFCQLALLSESLKWENTAFSPLLEDERKKGLAPIPCMFCGEMDAIVYQAGNDELILEPYCVRCFRTLSGCEVLECERCEAFYSDEDPVTPEGLVERERKQEEVETFWISKSGVGDPVEKARLEEEGYSLDEYELVCEYISLEEDRFSTHLCPSCIDAVFHNDD